MTQQQVEMKKKARKIFSAGTKSLKSIMQDMETDLELNQNFSWVIILIKNKKLFQKRH